MPPAVGYITNYDAFYGYIKAVHTVQNFQDISELIAQPFFLLI